MRKELACGLIFSAGTTLSLLTHEGVVLSALPGWFWVAALLFVGLCGWNCLTIANLESSADAAHDAMAASQRSPGWLRHLTWGLASGLMLSLLCYAWSGLWLFLAMALGWLGLLSLARPRWQSGDWPRVAADACLLAPLVWLLWA